MKTLLIAALLCAVGVNSASAQSGAVEKEVLRLFTILDTAQIKKDRATMERLMADDFIYTHSNGSVANKAQEIKDNMSSDTAWTGSTLTDTKVRVFGDVAVITGAQTLTGNAKGYVSGGRRFTDIWVKRNGQWVDVGGQTTLAPK